jgi:hypothetical protein
MSALTELSIEESTILSIANSTDPRRTSRKLSDLMKEHRASTYGDIPFVSIEFFPPRSDEGVLEMFSHLEKLTIVPQPNSSAIPLYAKIELFVYTIYFLYSN